jgi:hypothetical protein
VPPPFDLLLPRGRVEDLCATMPEVGRRVPFVALRAPAELDAGALRGVRGLYAFAPFRCRAPAPGVEQLLLEHRAVVDERTARAFTGVTDLALGMAGGPDLRWFSGAPLDGLSTSDRGLADPRVLRALPLRRLNLTWLGTPLDQLPETLEWLSVARVAPLGSRALDPIWELPRLATLRLVNVELGTLAAVGRAPALTSLSIQSTRSLRGVAKAAKLRELKVTGVACPPIAEVVECASLRALRIRSKAPPPDLAVLARAAALESLTLDLGDIHGLGDVESLAFLSGLPALKELRLIRVHLVDRDLGPIVALPALERLELRGAFGKGASTLARRRRGRGRETVVYNLAAPARRAPTTPRRIRGRWTIFEDVASLLGAPSNHEADARVRRRLKAEAPDLLARLEFDSEADAFAATASSKADAERLAAVIRAMARPQPAAAAGARGRRRGSGAATSPG